MLESLLSHNFTNGPEIEVLIVPCKKTVFRVLLKESLVFSVSFFTHLDPFLEKNILLWLTAYGNKKTSPLHFLPKQILPAFSAKMLTTLSEVPFGALISYQDLAVGGGNPLASRAAGTFCRKNPFPLLIPCHRIITSSGHLGGFAFGLSIKKTLLAFEGNSSFLPSQALVN